MSTESTISNGNNEQHNRKSKDLCKFSKDELNEILTFFVTVAQKKILTRSNTDKTLATDFYSKHHRYNTGDNSLSLSSQANPSWSKNISKYVNDGVKEFWFSDGLECVHFKNGSAQFRNSAYKYASIHLSPNHRYAVEFKLDCGDTNGDNLIKKLEARLFNVWNGRSKDPHSDKHSGYTSTKIDGVIFGLPVNVDQYESGEIRNVSIEISDENFSRFSTCIREIDNYFTKENTYKNSYENV